MALYTRGWGGQEDETHEGDEGEDRWKHGGQDRTTAIKMMRQFSKDLNR